MLNVDERLNKFLFYFCVCSVWNEIITNCVELASSNAQDIKRQLEFAGVTYIAGLASFPDSGGTQSMVVSKQDNSMESIVADKFLICTGSQPFRPGGIPFDGKRVFDSDTINQVISRVGPFECKWMFSLIRSVLWANSIRTKRLPLILFEH